MVLCPNLSMSMRPRKRRRGDKHRGRGHEDLLRATLIASQITDTIEYGAGAAPAAAKPEPVVAGLAASIVAANAAPRKTAVAKPPYDEQARILDELGLPIANMPYHITDASGKTYKGLTDANGCCERVHTEGAESLKILAGVLALEKWQ
jgi:hypothetical protein